jgi:hypothetical protein
VALAIWELQFLNVLDLGKKDAGNSTGNSTLVV